MAIAWATPEAQSAVAERVINTIGDAEIHVPMLFWFEIANVLLVKERRAALTPADALNADRRLRQLDMINHDACAYEALATLARAHRLTAYDAAFLELAQRLDATLASLDARLCDAARAQGVAVFAP